MMVVYVCGPTCVQKLSMPVSECVNMSMLMRMNFSETVDMLMGENRCMSEHENVCTCKYVNMIVLPDM